MFTMKIVENMSGKDYPETKAASEQFHPKVARTIMKAWALAISVKAAPSK